MQRKTALFGGALVTAGMIAGASAQVVVMDFQSLEMGGTGFSYWGTSYSANGFTISKDPSEPYDFTAAQTENTRFYQGSTMLFNNTIDGVTVLTQDNGQPFAMHSIALAALFVGVDDTTVNFTGNVHGGGQVFASFTTTNDAVGIQTFSFAGLGFDNIDSLVWVQEFNGAFHQFDDITVVPAPPSLALMGLAAFAAARRRR